MNELGDDVWTIESYAFNSAMRLSQEITNCSSTAFGILSQLGANFSDDVKRVYSDTLNSHYTSELFLERYEVSKILSMIEIEKLNLNGLQGIIVGTI